MKFSKTISIALLAFSFLVVFPYTTHALTISPARVELESDPGTTIGGDFILINEQKETKTFYASYENFSAQGETGVPSFSNENVGLAAWLSVPQETITLAPGEAKKVSFTIDIPNEAKPGGYFSAIFWSTTPPSANTGEVSIGAKVGMLVLLRVSGEIEEKGGVSDFETVDNTFFYNTLPVSMTYRFTNDGGDRVKPNGTLTLRNMLFIKADTLNANPVEGNILPQSTRKFSLEWLKNKEVTLQKEGSFIAKYFNTVSYQSKNFAFGLYFAKLTLAYGSQGSTTSDSLMFFVFPWQLLLFVFCILVVVYFIGKKLIRKYNRYVIEKARMSVQNNDTKI
jgi:hypothetical protein